MRTRDEEEEEEEEGRPCAKSFSHPYLEGSSGCSL